MGTIHVQITLIQILIRNMHDNTYGVADTIIMHSQYFKRCRTISQKEKSVSIEISLKYFYSEVMIDNWSSAWSEIPSIF